MFYFICLIVLDLILQMIIVAFAVVYILMNYFDHQILISKLILIFFQLNLKIFFIKIDILKLILIYFYDSLKHIETINSDKSRCLMVLVINNVCELIILFLKRKLEFFIISFLNYWSTLSLLIVKGKFF